MEEYKRQANEVLDILDEKLLVYPVVQQASTATKVRASHLAVGLVSFLLCFIFYGFGGRLVSNLVGFAWPLYESFHSLKNKPQPGIVDEEDSQVRIQRRRSGGQNGLRHPRRRRADEGLPGESGSLQVTVGKCARYGTHVAPRSSTAFVFLSLRCDRCQWLTYWVVYSTFTLIESATDVLSLWIPLYPVVKVN